MRSISPGARRWWIGLSAALILLAAGAVYREYSGAPVRLYEVVRRDVVATIVASGRIASPNRVDIGSQIIGTVARVPVAEGEVVRAGQLLIELESGEARATVKQADASALQAEARLRQVRELQLPMADQSLRQAEANLANAKAQLERNRKLSGAGFIGQAALDDAQRNFDVAQTQVNSTRKQVESARPAGSDYALALTALEQARASQQAARARLAYLTLEAPVAGTLIARDVERGDVVQPGKVLMVLAPAGETQIVLQIDERNLSKLALGQQALASADAYPDQKFPAELVYVNPGIDAQRGTVEVRLRVPHAPAYLRQDMTVSVDIEIARRPATLALATESVRDIAGGTAWVLVVRDGIARRQVVRAGLRGDRSLEIVDGLSEGDLIVPGSAPIKAGQRVKRLRDA
jgi:HlyD family secretion protein